MHVVIKGVRNNALFDWRKAEMNKLRKQKIRDVRKEIESCKENLQKILDEEQDYFDNMPENLQSSIRGSDSEDAIDTMENCIEDLENIINELMNV